MNDKFGRLGHPNYFHAGLGNLRTDVAEQLTRTVTQVSKYKCPEDYYAKATNTLFMGDSRVGKTWLLHFILNKLLEIGIDQIYYTTVDELINAHRTKEKINDDTLWVTHFGSREILFLDGLGHEYKKFDSGFVSRTLEKFLRHRFNYNKVTILAGRVDGDTMEGSGYDMPLRDFISGEYKKISLLLKDGGSIKTIKNGIDTFD